MRFSFLIFLIVCGIGAQAQIVNIPDANFKNALVNEIVADTDGDGAIDGPVDTNGDGEIQVTEAEAVFRLKVDDFNIASLQGIQSFTNLRELECSNNNISSLDLSQSPNLKILSCIINQLTSLDVSQNPKLELFGFAESNLTINEN